MKRTPGLVLLLLCGGAALALPSPSGAQEAVRPTITRADTAAVLYGTATRLRAQGRRELAEELLRLVIDRYPDTPAAEQARGSLASAQRERRLAGGTGTLAAWGALYGGWLGVAIPAALGVDDPSPVGAGILLGIPAGFFAGKSYARSADLSAGQARAVTWGGLWGTYQGAGWREVFEIGYRTVRDCPPPGVAGPCFEYQEESEQAPFTAMILGGVGGMTVAALLVRNREISSGGVSAAQWGSLWGTWFGAASAAVLDINGEDSPLMWTLVGGNVGLLTTALLAPKWSLSGGRPWLVSAAGIAGLVAGLGLDLLFQVENERTAILLPLAGSVAGLATGASLTRSRGSSATSHTEPSPGGGLLRLPGGRPTYGGAFAAPTAIALPGPQRAIRWRPGVRVSLMSVALP